MATKIINGRKYSTDTAKYLWDYGVGHGIGSYELYLYRKRNGEYFFVHGGYKQTANGDYEWNWRFEPITEEEAMRITMKYADAYRYEAIFGEVEE